MYNEREYNKFAFLYSTLNPVEAREFGNNRIAKKALTRVINFRKQLGKLVVHDKFEDLYTKTFKDDLSKPNFLYKVFYLLVFLFLMDRIVRLNGHIFLYIKLTFFKYFK